MKTLAFDGQMGASGDMILAALIATGADPDALSPVEDDLPVGYILNQTNKSGIEATTVDVTLETGESERASGNPDSDHGAEHQYNNGDSQETEHGGAQDSNTTSGGDRPNEDGHASGSPAGHEHEHEHDHEGTHHHHGPDHDHSETDGASGTDSGHRHAEGAGQTRSYEEVVDILDSLSISETPREQAGAIFERLGRAEASVHGTDLHSTHFHEVGADDAIADIVGATLLLEDLGVEQVVTTPLATGDGDVPMSHGQYPIPAPAVVAIAETADWALTGGPVDAELLTPTGAAILAELADGVDRLPTLDLDASGYGAGGYSFPDRPNVLRAIVGDSRDGLHHDDITVLETNLDDATPETLGRLHDSLAEVGARDVSVMPVTMKKSRPGHLVKVVCKPADARRVARRLATETGTLGVRETGADHRFIADRAFETAQLHLADQTFQVAVKVARTGDGVPFDISAEYDDAIAVADETDMSVREIMRRAETCIQSGFEPESESP